MTKAKGEIIEEEHSIYSVLGVHLTGLIGIIMSVIWIGFIFYISYFEPSTQELFTHMWYEVGLILVLIPAISNLLVQGLIFFLGQVQIIKAFEAMKDIISGITILLLNQIFPFNFGEWNTLISTILIIVGILSFISAINHGYKFLLWEEKDTRSIRSRTE